MQFMVNITNAFVCSFLGLWFSLQKRSSYNHLLLLALFFLAECGKVWRVQTYLLVYGPSLMVPRSRQQGHCSSNTCTNTQKRKFHYTEQLLNESEKQLYLNIRTTLKLHIVILFLSYSPTVRIKCYLKQQERDPLPSVHPPKAWEKKQWKHKRKNIHLLHCYGWPIKK